MDPMKPPSTLQRLLYALGLKQRTDAGFRATVIAVGLLVVALALAALVFFVLRKPAF
jgi:hypothetical protein